MANVATCSLVMWPYAVCAADGAAAGAECTGITGKPGKCARDASYMGSGVSYKCDGQCHVPMRALYIVAAL